MAGVGYQPSLLDSLAPDTGPGLTGLAGRLRRHELSRGAWVDHLPGWVTGADLVLEVLLAGVPWRAGRRRMYDGVVDVPRLLEWYGPDRELPHPLLAEARERLSQHYAGELGEPFVTAGLCLYRDGRDSVAWHGDTEGRSAHADTLVAIVGFGSPRPLLLRPRGGGARLRFPLGHGDLLVMGGSCQRTWEHAILKTTRAVGPRVSVQLRPAGVA
jgi:alkylated DNA repair dioxygenase AlkB